MARQYKTLHLLRHARGYHNLPADEVHLGVGLLHRLVFEGGWRRITVPILFRIWRSFWRLMLRLVHRALILLASPGQKLTDDNFDASLTAIGWQQVLERRRQIAQSGVGHGIELIVVSPMTRTLQTAAGVFGSEDIAQAHDDDGAAPPQPLMVDGVGKCPFPGGAISSVNCCPPLVALELCREHIGLSSADHRRPISSYKVEFPGVDFSLVESDEDTLWRCDREETDQEMHQRIQAFLHWLLSRPEEEMAVVSHCGFLSNMLRQFGDKELALAADFANCDLRTVAIGKDEGHGLTVSLLKSYPHVSVL